MTGLLAYTVVCGVALVVSALTLFSGFGLGTLLMPAFALFFPVPAAIAATALVHLANNLWKLALVGRHADGGVVVRFALPGALGAVVGARALGLFAGLPVLARYPLGGQVHEISVVKVVVGALMVAAAALELVPRFQAMAFERRFLPLGGLLSGFFGGLSGHQGALRSAFLVKAELSKEAFVGTGVVAAVIVDVSRLLVYGRSWVAGLVPGAGALVAAATLAACAGSLAGARLLHKVTFRSVQLLVGGLLLLVALALVAGLV